MFRLQPILIWSKPFTKLTLDYLGHLPKYNKKLYILVADLHALLLLRLLRKRMGKQYYGQIILEDILPCYGVWAEKQPDSGTHFVADTLRRLYKALGIEHWASVAYRLQSQGITVQYNSKLINMLQCYVNEDQMDWHKYVKLVTFKYNSSKYTLTWFLPFYLLHGFETNQLIDLTLLPTNPNTDV